MGLDMGELTGIGLRRNYNEQIDILRAISALAVITVHVTASFTQISEFNQLQVVMAYIDNLSAFAVPSFVFISGLVLYKNYYVLHGTLLKFYKKRFSKILPAYLLFSLFYIGIFPMYSLIRGREINLNILGTLYKLFTGGAYHHLWFFSILFQLYLVYPLILKLYNKYKNKLLFVCFIIQFVWTYLGDDVVAYIWNELGVRNRPFPLALSNIFWFVLGICYLDNKEKIVKVFNMKIGIISIIILGAIRTAPLFYGLQKYNYETIPKNYFMINTIIDPLFF